MTINPKIKEFIATLDEQLNAGSFVKLSLGNYKGEEPQLKNIYVKRVTIRNTPQLSFTYHYKTRDVVKNYPIADGVAQVRDYMTGGFYIATLFTTDADWICENIHDTRYVLRKGKPTHQAAPALGHNRDKKRMISAKEKSYLHALGITDAKGDVLKTAQDKYKQINKYIEIIDTLLKDIPSDKIKRVVDMGSGKGYLTFALYDYLMNAHIRAQVTGVEYRQDMVDLCNKIADDADFTELDFVQGTIEKYDDEDMDVLVALHACDTATDEAIYKGITAKAELIVVAPCCHKQIRREIEKSKTKNDLDFLLRHGIFMERECEMVTDGIRALILEYFGYSVKVFEFISDAHTAKNVLIVGTRTGKTQNKAVLEKIQKAKAYFGIKQHKLEQLLDI